MFHFLSDLPRPGVSGSEQHVKENENPSQQNIEKKKRGRPKKSLEGGEKPQNPENTPVMIKCEPEQEGTLQSKKRKRNQPADEFDKEYVNSDPDENSLSGDGEVESNNEVVKGKRGGRRATAAASANTDNEGGVRNNRRRRNNDNSPENDDVFILDDESDDEVPAKKGGKRKKRTAPKKGPVKKIPEVEEDAVDLTKIIKCASCKEEMQNKDFTKHNLTKHNSLGWIHGDPPVDLNDERSLMTILKRVLKQTKKKYLVCDKCGVEKKSCLGYITHKRVCGKSIEERYRMQVTCELCGRKMMPVSLKSHMASHAKPKLDGVVIETGRKRAAASKAKSRLNEFLTEDGSLRPLITPVRTKLLYSSPKPRKAPSKTIAKWRSELLANNPAKCFNIDCSFETDNVETMKEHFKVCDFAEENPTTYNCLLCVFKSEDENTIREHVATLHPQGSEDNAVEIVDSGSDIDEKDIDDQVSDEFDSDEDDRHRIRVRPFLMKSKRPCHRFRFLAKEDTNRSSALDTFSPTLMWTLQYRIENDSPSLFHEFLSTEEDWQLMPVSEIEQYLPATKTSVHVAFGDPENGIRFSLFDSTVVDDSSAIFVGGPVWATAWCPLPLDLSVKYKSEVSQFLAVSCHREMDQFHGIYSCYTGPNVIQLWDVGSLNNTDSPQVPKLALSIVHDFGTVWRMEWCPSGAYGTSATGKLKRLGLLAAACSDGFVHIFSVCFPDELHAHIKMNQAPIYRCKPVLTLKPNSPELTQCTRVSWHRVKGHGLIAGGYCDGKVALWNLENYSSLLYNKDDRELYPYHTFQAHYSVVSALSLSPEGQYLMTGSRDCSVKFWNLEDTNAPITVNRKGLVTDGAWLTHWMCAMTTYDDAYLHEHSNATLIPIREFGFKPYPVLPQNSVAWCLSESAWLNSLVQGSLAGEIALNIAGQLFLGLDNEKFPTRKRLLVCCTELRDLIQISEGNETLGAEPTKPSQVKEGGKSNDKTKEKNNKSKSKTSGKAKDKTADVVIDEDNDKDVEEIPVEDAEKSSTTVDLKPRDYKDTAEKYGINIRNFLNFKIGQIPPEVTQPMRQSNAMNQVHSEMYPITSINQVQWNPNLKSCLWLAVGHQCGLLRLVCLKYMHSPTLSRFYSKAEAVLKRAHSSYD